jgi:hypothetical protein
MSARTTGMGGHQSARMEKDEWLTPPPILRALGHFDLDPCAPVNRPWDMAARHYTIEDNGLLKPWEGRVWLNPPYGPPTVVGPWLRRMAEHGHGTALIFARTETDLFFETVWKRATAVLFIRGRLYFHVAADTWFDRNGAPSIFVKAGGQAQANSGAPSVLVAYGRADAAILRGSGIDGRFVDLAPSSSRSASPSNEDARAIP